MNDEPKVFISYSHDSESHKAWVLKLATDLRDHGVDAILDEWDLKLGEDIVKFMEDSVIIGWIYSRPHLCSLIH